MKRRKLLLGTGCVVSGFSGCIGSRNGGNNVSEGSEGSVNGNNDIEYERCGLTYIPLIDLPTPAKKEADTAIKNDVYETDRELVLSGVIDINRSYLTAYRENQWIYYEMVVTTDSGVTCLYGEETRRKKASLPTVRNKMEIDVTIDIRIEYEGNLLLKDTVDLAAGKSVRLNNRDDYSYGRYHATLKIQTGEGVREENVSWIDNHVQSSAYIAVASDEVVVEGPSAGKLECEWNDEGELVSGPRK